jgi:hypothetical protein
MAYQPLNRDGRPSSRNKSRAFRPPRIVVKDGVEKFHEMDMMRLSPSGRAVNSTGCFGTVSTWGMGRISVIVKRGAPGKERAPRPKKRVSKLYSGKEHNIYYDFQKISFEQCRGLRAKLMTAKLMGQHAKINVLPHGYDVILQHITKYLQEKHPEKMAEISREDRKREDSVAGMMRSNKIKLESIRSLDTKIKRLLYLMEMTPNEVQKAARVA